MRDRTTRPPVSLANGNDRSSNVPSAGVFPPAVAQRRAARLHSTAGRTRALTLRPVSMKPSIEGLPESCRHDAIGGAWCFSFSRRASLISTNRNPTQRLDRIGPPNERQASDREERLGRTDRSDRRRLQSERVPRVGTVRADPPTKRSGLTSVQSSRVETRLRRAGSGTPRSRTHCWPGYHPQQ